MYVCECVHVCVGIKTRDTLARTDTQTEIERGGEIWRDTVLKTMKRIA